MIKPIQHKTKRLNRHENMTFTRAERRTTPTMKNEVLRQKHHLGIDNLPKCKSVEFS